MLGLYEKKKEKKLSELYDKLMKEHYGLSQNNETYDSI